VNDHSEVRLLRLSRPRQALCYIDLNHLLLILYGRDTPFNPIFFVYRHLIIFCGCAGKGI
jgi:hypothetical protein